MHAHRTYQKSPSWNLFIENDALFITKGADELYLVDDADLENARAIEAWYKKDVLSEPDESDVSFLRVIEKLKTAGVVFRGRNDSYIPSRSLLVGIKWYGQPNKRVEKLLTEYVSHTDGLAIATSGETPDMLLFIRTTGPLSSLLEGYKDISMPHLFVDLAYDHMLSVGPLVFPGEAACLGCFIGRITRNWGDIVPPEAPNAGAHHEFIASIIFEHVKKFQQRGSCPELIGCAWSLNLNDFIAKYDKVFRLPWCPICFPDKPQEGAGSFELPWVKKS